MRPLSDNGTVVVVKAARGALLATLIVLMLLVGDRVSCGLRIGDIGCPAGAAGPTLAG